MKQYTVNANGLAQIRAHLAERTKKGGEHFTDSMIHAWAEKVEQSLSDNGHADFEIRSWDTISGHTELCSITDDGIDARDMLVQYSVTADCATGEWLSEPEEIGLVFADDWSKMIDTDAVHYDTYEHDEETRAVEVHLI